MFERKLERDHSPTVPPSSSCGSPNPCRRWNEASGLRKKANGNLAGASQDVPGGSSRDPCTDVERRLGPRPRVSTAPKKCPKTLLHEDSNGFVEPASSRSRGRKTSRRTPRHHGRRRDPQPTGWTVSDEEAGAERSEALSPLASSQSGTTRAAVNEQGFRSLGCRRTACATHPPREQSRGRRTSKGAKAQERIGR